MCKLHPGFEEKRIKRSKAYKEKMTPEFLANLGKKISETVRKKVLEGTWHYSFSKTRTYTYKGEKLHGKWELQYAEWLDSKNLLWERPKEKFSYFFENKERYYTPDFYLVESKTYVEIKGYETEKDRAKWECFPHKLVVLKGKDLHEMNVITTDQFKGLK